VFVYTAGCGMALDTRYSRPGPDGGEALDANALVDGALSMDHTSVPGDSTSAPDDSASALDATQADASVAMDATSSDGATSANDGASSSDGANVIDVSTLNDGALMDHVIPPDSVASIDARSDTGIRGDAADVQADVRTLMDVPDSDAPTDTGIDTGRIFCPGTIPCGSDCCDPLRQACVGNVCQPRLRPDADVDPSG
jgi:hypothetical protein